MLTAKKRRLVLLLAPAGVALGAVLYLWLQQPPGPLEKIHERGTIRILTRNAPTTYYEGREGPEGYEYELTQAFAEALGVQAEYRFLDSVDAIVEAVAAGEADLAAAGITRTPTREARGRFGPSYMDIAEQVVCRRGGPRPDSVNELTDVSVLVAAGTSYIETLEQLREALPELTWEATGELSTEQIMQAVWEGKADCTVADSTIVAINRRYYPELTVEFDLSAQQSLAWFLPPDAARLQSRLDKWFGNVKEGGLLDILYRRYYGYAEIFDFVDIRAFKRRIEKRLPRYRTLFEQAGERHGIPWDLLAAQAYQESHWSPRAVSPTGVRGIMMLTRRTARSLDVTDRVDPAQSIDGGARYLRRMIQRVPDSVVAEDRLWFALAAYNIGMGHIHDARRLAEKLGRNPDRWSDMTEVLPLLTQEKYYTTLKYGYARGTEPVLYVRRIRNYRDILRQALQL